MKDRRNESGMALMLALLFVVLLTVIVVEFCYETQVEGSLAEHYVNQQQAYVAAKSAVARGMNLLAVDIDQALEGETTGNTGMEGGIFDCLEDEWAIGAMPEPINEAISQCMVADEYGKINLNALVRDPMLEGGSDPESQDSLVDSLEPDPFVSDTLRALFAFRGTEEDPVDAIIDWIDPDDSEQFEGAEYDYYEGLDPAFGCKDGPMHSVEELLMIPGITPEIFWGDPEEGQLPLTELLTVHGHPQGYININTAEYEVLQAVGEAMEPQMPDLADTIMDDRGGSGQRSGGLQRSGSGQEDGGGYFATETEVRDYLGIQEEPRAATPNANRDQGNTGGSSGGSGGAGGPAPFPFVVDSYVFRVRGHGLAGDSAVRIEAYVWRDNGQTGDDMMEPFRILDWRVIR